MSYLHISLSGNLNIRIHRDITGLPDGLFGGCNVVWEYSHLDIVVYIVLRNQGKNQFSANSFA